MEENFKKKTGILYIIIGILLVLLLITVFILGRNSSKELNSNVYKNQINQQDNADYNQNDEINLSEEELSKIELVKSSKTEVKGIDLITPDNKVINIEGDIVRTDVFSFESGAPTQSKSLVREDLSENVLNIEVSLGSFNPNIFTVEPGQAITIALTSIDEHGHSLVFRDPILKGFGIAVKSGETRAMTFNVPTEPGEYDFYCNVGGDKYGHASKGGLGKMIVK